MISTCARTVLLYIKYFQFLSRIIYTKSVTKIILFYQCGVLILVPHKQYAQYNMGAEAIIEFT